MPRRVSRRRRPPREKSRASRRSSRRPSREKKTRASRRSPRRGSHRHRGSFRAPEEAEHLVDAKKESSTSDNKARDEARHVKQLQDFSYNESLPDPPWEWNSPPPAPEIAAWVIKQIPDRPLHDRLDQRDYDYKYKWIHGIAETYAASPTRLQSSAFPTPSELGAPERASRRTTRPTGYPRQLFK